MSFNALFRKKENDDEEKVTKTTLMDNIAIITEFKYSRKIFDNGCYFYAAYKLEFGKKRNTKKAPLYKNMISISLDGKNLPKPYTNADGTGVVIQKMYFDVQSWPLLRYLSYSNLLFVKMLELNSIVTTLSDKEFILLVESILPQRKLFISNLNPRRKELVPENVKIVASFFNVSKYRAREYLNLLSEVNKDKEFVAALSKKCEFKESKKRKK